MFSTIKLAKNGNKYLYFMYKGQAICIFENQKELINEILTKLNIVDSADVADLDYLKSKLTEDTTEIFYWTYMSYKKI